MHQIAMMMAGMMPKEDLIEQLEDSIKEYKINPTDENWNSVSVMCSLIGARSIIDHNGGDLEGVMKTVSEMDKLNKTKEFFNPKQN
ncbi:hypothetical protein ACTS94_05110 [Empedobacter falsenii]